MEHNQHLNEIKYLLRKYFKEENVNRQDLETICSYSRNISDDKYEEEFTNDKINVIPIDDAVAQDYLDKFNKYFFFHPTLSKTFRIQSTLFKNSIQKLENITLRLIDYNGSFELAYLIGGEAFLIDYKNDKLTLLTNLNTHEKNFDDGIGKDLDLNLKTISNNTKITNTRKIMINYYGNFDNTSDFTLSDDTYIYFIPAIIDNHSDTNNHQFTLLMFFGDKTMITTNKPPMKIKIEKVYYDTFQLCPPTC